MSSRFESVPTRDSLSTVQKRRVYQTIAISLLAVLTVETIPLPIPVYIAPATSLGALALLPAIYWLHGNPKRSPLFCAITIFAAYAVIQSALAVSYDILTHGTGLIRVRLWASQLLALGVGVSVYYVFRVTLPTLTVQNRVRIITLSGVASLLPALLSVAYIVTDINAFGVIPRLVNAFAPTGFDGAWRANGFASEPAHYSFFLITIFIPVALIGGWRAYNDGRNWRPWAAVAVLSTIALAGTLSTTGILMFVLFIGVYLLLSRRWKLATAAVTITSVIVAAVVISYPSLYISEMIRFLITGGWRHSILTRYYSTVGPLVASVTSLHGFVGYGFGSTALYANEILPPAALDGIQHASAGGAGIHLKTLIGRVVAAMGIPGILLYGMIYVASYAQISRIHNYQFSPWDWTVEYRVIATALVIAVLGQGIGAASYAIPAVWLWFAWIDVDSLPTPRSSRL